ncbi:MAG: prepilin-type N-terminal cleavage/methylation domain-containing protein [Betaproteobacteria bacterium]|jgi:type IV pilus assembly protein PilE|nr:MAG: prepilin-type N-terminal cleavage/methylation domain-containing protein [Betaproteobacteria bacterium]
MKTTTMSSAAALHCYSRARGFTLIELLIAVAIAAILASVAYPAFGDSVRASRRSDAIVTIWQVQQAQELYRTSNAAYGDRFLILTSTGSMSGVARNGDVAPNGTSLSGSFATSAGHYAVTLSGVDTTGYSVLATAQGPQASDANCKYMQVDIAGGNLVYNSGATSGTSNGSSSAANKRCWKQ